MAGEDNDVADDKTVSSKYVLFCLIVTENL